MRELVCMNVCLWVAPESFRQACTVLSEHIVVTTASHHLQRSLAHSLCALCRISHHSTERWLQLKGMTK